jgi:hypothetical protein
VKKLTPEQFDAQLRQRLEQFEMPYDAAAWARFETQLPAQTAPAAQMAGWLKGLAAAAVVGSMGIAAIYLWPQEQLADNAAQSISADGDENGNNVTVSGDSKNSASAMTQRTESQSTSYNVGRPLPESHAEEVAADRPGDEHNAAQALHSGSARPVGNLSAQVGNDTSSPEGRASGVMSSESGNIHLRLIMSKTEICAGEQVSFMALTDKGGLQYRWSFGDGEESLAAEPSRSFDIPGRYDVTLSASKGTQQWQRTQTIEVRPAPEAAIEELKPLSPKLPMYTVSTILQPGETCTWAFSDGRVSPDAETRQLFRYRGTAEVELNVTNAFGCTTTSRQNVRVAEDFRLFAETGFTPDGDGINDTFLPKALEVMECGFEMTIRDLNGREVFRSSSVDDPWNGKEFNTGAALPKGVYIWTVVLTDDVLHNPVFSSDITLR